jgi:hypothetical protein
MSQVIIEFTQVAASTGGRDAPIPHYVSESVEITSAGTAADTGSVVTKAEAINNVVSVVNNGTDTIWVAFGATATAASPSRIVPPNTIRDFGNVPKGVNVSVINDS